MQYIVKLTEEQKKITLRALEAYRVRNRSSVTTQTIQMSVMAQKNAEECDSALEALSTAKEVTDEA